MNRIWRFMECADIPMFKAIIIGIVGVIIIQAVHCGSNDSKEIKVMADWKETKLEYQWPEVFDTKELGGRPDAALCADGLEAWGISMAGAKQHPNFGEVIAKIALKLGILGTLESFMEKAKEYDGSRKEGNDG